MKEKKKLSLPAWIFIGMLAGIVAGLIFAFAGLGDFTTEWIKPIGTIYVNLLKFLVVPVVLFSIADGVISLKDLKRVGSVGLKTFVYYMITTALAVVIGLVLVNLFKGSFTPLPSADLGALEYEAKEAPSVMQVIVNIFPSNLLQPMVSSDMLPVIVTAIFLGAGVLAAGEKGQRVLPHDQRRRCQRCRHHRQAGTHHRCCVPRLYRPCRGRLWPVRQVPLQDEPHQVLQGSGPGYDHRVYHHVLQRDAARQHRVLQRHGRGA